MKYKVKNMSILARAKIQNKRFMLWHKKISKLANDIAELIKFIEEAENE